MAAKSLGELLRRSVAENAERTAFLVPEQGSFTPVTYKAFYERVRAYAGALKKQGLTRGDRVAIISENGIEWSLADWASQCLGLVVVPIYATLPADQAAYIVTDAGAKLVLIGSEEHRAKVECLPNTQVLLLKGKTDSLDAMAAGATEALPMQDFDAEIDQTGAEDLCSIIYTSGTTGLPKGAMMPHRAFINVCEAVPVELPLGRDDVFLSFLPQSHVYERVAGQFLPISLGATIGFAKNLASLANDLIKVKPTVLMCVPRFLEAFRDRAMDGVSKLPPLRQRLFHLALAQGVKRAQGHFAPLAGLLDGVVMKKVRERMGGRIRFLVSGGAALPAHVAEFYMAAGLTVLQGYGLTETSGGSVVNRPERNKYWTVGEPLGVEIKIAEDGEILLRGPGIMLGYYNLPEETAAALDSDGFFHTGDIGEFEGPNLKITDRKKDLLVLGNGKNVAPQPIENKLKSSPFISEAVLLGDGMDSCVALIVPNPELVRKTLGLDENVVLSQSPEAKALIKKEIDKVNKTLASFEMVKRHSILDNAFSVESGELTPTFKVKRKVILQKYADQIAQMH